MAEPNPIRCESRLYWPDGIRARCMEAAGHDGPHSSNTYEWTTEGAELDPPKYRVRRRQAVR